ncbi:unnamed protein product [Camellia sinensis]
MGDDHFKPFAQTESPKHGNTFSNFDDDDFEIYVKKNQLFCERGKFSRGWVFWNQEDERCEFLPEHYFQLCTVITENLIQKIKSFFRELRFLQEQVLVQFWKALEFGGGYLLTTKDQPFALNTTHEGLCSYRLISVDYQFYVDGESDECLGLPGRVFQYQRPEFTPNVRYYSCKEYPQRDRAVNSNIWGSLALPVFDASGWGCVGVLELVTSAEMKHCISLFKHWICNDLEAVGLRSSRTCNYSYCQHDEDKALEIALVEIRVVLEVVCRTHFLPLAQTWILCRPCSAVAYDDSFGVSCLEQLTSIIDVVCLREKDKFPFSNACASHHIRKGQGVVGRAYSSNKLVFCKDITQFSIIEYPLAHYAHEYGLTSCFAICLRSSYTGDNVYVVEFFLPPSHTEGEDPMIIVVPLLTTMKQHFQSFMVASGEELGEQLPIEVIDLSKDDKLDSLPQIARSPADRMEIKGQMEWQDLSDQQLIKMDTIYTGNDVVSKIEKTNNVVASSFKKCIPDSSQRQYRKAGIQISFEDIQQHFGMKLNDAAKSLCVSRSTLKRACREYNISCWSTRKRNKENETLSNKFVQVAARDQIRQSSQSSISDPCHRKYLATAAPTEPHFMAAQATSIVTLKVKYGDDYIKFQFPVLSGMVEFQQEVAKRLSLKAGAYIVKYQDDNNDWILIACDEDLQDYICNSRSLGRNTIKMLLQPISNCSP